MGHADLPLLPLSHGLDLLPGPDRLRTLTSPWSGTRGLEALVMAAYANGCSSLLLRNGEAPLGHRPAQTFVLHPDAPTAAQLKTLMIDWSGRHDGEERWQAGSLVFTYPLRPDRLIDLQVAVRVIVEHGPDHGRGPTVNVRMSVKPPVPPPLKTLDLPDALVNRLTPMPRQGLILAGGPVGVGTTTLLASLARHWAEHPPRMPAPNQPGRAYMVGDPCEYRFPEILAQLLVRIDLHDLGDSTVVAQALRQVLARCPGLVMVGECRDAIVHEQVVVTAMTGHLVLAEAYSSEGVVGMLERQMGLFPAEQQVSRGIDLLSCLRSILWQRCVPGIDGPVRLREYLILDEGLLDRLDALMKSPSGRTDPGRAQRTALLHRTMQEQGSDLASDARRQHRAGRISDTVLEQVLTGG